MKSLPEIIEGLEESLALTAKCPGGGLACHKIAASIRGLKAMLEPETIPAAIVNPTYPYVTRKLQ